MSRWPLVKSPERKEFHEERVKEREEKEEDREEEDREEEREEERGMLRIFKEFLSCPLRRRQEQRR
jgi:hypothetical protein